MSNPADYHARYYRAHYGRSLRAVECLARDMRDIRDTDKTYAACADTVIAECETDRIAMRAALRAQPMTEVSYV